MSLIGLALIVSPFNAVQAFGIDPSHLADLELAPGMGVRQLAIGLTIVALAFMRQAKALGAVLLIGSLVPIGDFAIAGKALGYTAAVRHLITLPFSLILGLVLVRK
ncbi:MAG: DUF4267 domain-containing protein [Rhodomicrobium sp.]|nr:DUF4267 domain-containing protein [Rhodomicrobium sp.]